VCRFEACDGHFKRQIYLSDVDFKVCTVSVLLAVFVY